MPNEATAEEYQRPRIRGNRWLVFSFDDQPDDSPDALVWFVRIVTSRELADHEARAHAARTGENCTYLKIPPVGARNLIRLGVPYDRTTIADLARMADVDRDTIRRALRRKSVKSPNMPSVAGRT